MGASASATIIVLLTWGAFCVKMQTLGWRLRDPVRRASGLALLAVALAMTTLHPLVYVAVDRAVGIPNLARLLGNGLGVVGMWAIEPVIVRLLHSQRRTSGVFGNGWLMVVTLVVMSALFLGSGVAVEAPFDFQQRYGAEPPVAAYRLLVMLYMGSGVFRIFRVALRNERAVPRIPRRRFRVEARLQTVGWAAGALYALQEIAVTALRLLGALPAHFYLTRVATLLLFVGFTGIFNAEIVKFALWLRRSVALRQLYPLSRDLYRALPSIALHPPASDAADLLSFRDVNARVYRRVIEIHDGLVKLQPYSNREATAYLVERHCVATSLRDELPETEALAVIIALAAHGRAHRGDGKGLTQHSVHEWALDGEVRHLCRLSTAYRRLRADRTLMRAVTAVLAGIYEEAA